MKKYSEMNDKEKSEYIRKGVHEFSRTYLETMKDLQHR